MNTSRTPALMEAISPDQILQSMLTGLNDGRISEVVNQFGDDFTYNDHALDLEFTDKERLIEFLQKAHDFFPDTTLKVDAAFACGDHAVAVWKLTATQTESYGTMHYRAPVILQGSTLIRTKNGKVIQWSDYYDKLTSRRSELAASFKDWIEY